MEVILHVIVIGLAVYAALLLVFGTLLVTYALVGKCVRSRSRFV